ncbi:MAG: DUF416 family protein [Caldilineaceae bacterium]
MSSVVRFIEEVVQPNLSQLTNDQILCFASSCAERMVPLIGIWDSNIAKIVTKCVELGWEHSQNKTLPYDDSSRLRTLYETYDCMLDVDPKGYDDVHLLAENAIRTCTGLIEYAQSQSVTEAKHCSEYNFAVIEDLAEIFLLETSTFYSNNEVTDSEILVIEMNKQNSDLNTLVTSELTEETLHQLRVESQQLGKTYLEKYQSYLMRRHRTNRNL